MARRLRDILFLRLDPVMGLVFCGLALVAIWAVAAHMPGVGGPFFGWVLHKPRTLPEGTQTRLLFLAFVPYVIGYRAAMAAKFRGTRLLTGAFAVLMAVTLVAKVLPFVSHDVFIYAFQGRAVAVHGINPYAVEPNEVDDPYVEAMGTWLSGLKDTYGPLWTDVSALAAAAAGKDPVLLLGGLKAITALFFLAGIPLVALLLDERLARRPKPARDALVLLYAWNPALLLEFAGNGHNDSAMVFFLLLALVLARRRRHVFASLAVAASFLMKYVTLLAAPFFVAHAVREAGPSTREKLAAFASTAGPMAFAAVVAYAPYWLGPATFDGLVTQAAHAGMDIASPFAFAVAFGIGGPHRVLSQSVLEVAQPIASVAFLASSIALLFVAARRRTDLARSSFSPMVCYLAFACTWFMPWYLGWLAPLFVMEGAAVAAVVMAGAGVFLYQSYYTAPVLAAAIGMILLASKLRRARPAEA